MVVPVQEQEWPFACDDIEGIPKLWNLRENKQLNPETARP